MVGGESHQNGDVESSSKRALDQALRVRGSRDFRDRAAYEQFLAELVRAAVLELVDGHAHGGA